MSRSDVVRRLRALASRGVPISVRYLLPVHADLVGQALAIFGSFDRARAVAGLAAPPLEHDVDVIIGALRSLSRSGVRLDVGTLSTMGESGLVAACVETFGSVAAAAARAGLGAPPPEPTRRPGYGQHESRDAREGRDYRDRDRDRGYGGGYHGHGPPGFAQPPLTADGNVSTALALETLQKTALQLGRVPAARDLPPDVARRLTTDYGSVRFAYLALRVHAEGQGGARTAEGVAQAAAEPVAQVTQAALEATARLPDSVGVHRRNVEQSLEAAAAAPAPIVVSDEELEAAWAEVEAELARASAAAAARIHAALDGAIEGFVDAVTDLAKAQALEALVPWPAAGARVEEEEEDDAAAAEEDADEDEAGDEEELDDDGDAELEADPGDADDHDADGPPARAARGGEGARTNGTSGHHGPPGHDHADDEVDAPARPDGHYNGHARRRLGNGADEEV